MTFNHTVEDFEAALPPSEVLPLLMVRQALRRWYEARFRADRATDQSATQPADHRLARCAAQLRREDNVFRELAARAVQEWASQQVGPIYVQDTEGEPAIVRVDPGEVPTLQIIRPGKADFPAESEVFDLVEAEKALACQAVDVVVQDARVREAARTLINRPFNLDRMGDYLGAGQTHGWFAYIQTWAATQTVGHEEGR